ncbi:hypothetical protein D3C75_960550 [compost metagenome]
MIRQIHILQRLLADDYVIFTIRKHNADIYDILFRQPQRQLDIFGLFLAFRRLQSGLIPHHFSSYRRTRHGIDLQIFADNPL